MNAMFLVSKVLKHLSLSPGLYFSHYTIQKEAKDPHATSKIYSHNNKKKQAENNNRIEMIYFVSCICSYN